MKHFWNFERRERVVKVWADVDGSVVVVVVLMLAVHIIKKLN